MKNQIKASLSTLLLVLSLSAQGNSPDGLWRDGGAVGPGSLGIGKSTVYGQAGEKEFPYREKILDLEGLSAMLSSAPPESAPQGLRFYFPHPDGRYIPLEAFYSPVVEPGLEEKYPLLKTYKVFGIGNKQISGRMGFSADGFYARLDTPQGSITIESEATFTGEGSGYRVFFTGDAPAGEADDFEESYPEQLDEAFGEGRAPFPNQLFAHKTVEPGLRLGDQLRVYRLAMSMKAELTQALGGTKAQGMEFIGKVVNLLNQIYEKELSIRLVLVANNDALVYTDPNTDPFKTIAWHTKENRENTHAVIGAENYDIGHLLTYQRGTPGAAVAAMCIDDENHLKASAMSKINGLSDEVWQEKVVDYLAHEIGHQFGAWHTQGKSTCHSDEGSAWEMFSGSTIMAYAGVCSPSLQQHSDPVFHAGSRQQIIDFVEKRSQCGTIIETGDTAPTVDAGADYVIPVGTPFVLSALSEDIDTGDADSLSFTWDQMDAGSMDLPFNSGELEWEDPGKGPLFRSTAPTSSSERVFPKLETILAGKTANFGETLPSTNRDINFLVTARSGRYGLAQDDVKLTAVTSAGPFKVVGPTGTSFEGGADIAVTWDVAGTDQPPVNCAKVDIHLSLDGGQQFDIALKSATANDGGEVVTLPDSVSDQMRFRVKCSDNIFFAVSPGETSLDPVVGTGNISIEAETQSVAEGDSGVTTLPVKVQRQYANDTLSINYEIAGMAAQSSDGGNEGVADEVDFVNGFVSSSLVLAPGQSSATITVEIQGDLAIEPNENFYVGIFEPSSGQVTKPIEVLTILNDDVEDDPDTGGEPDDGGSGSGGEPGDGGSGSDGEPGDGGSGSDGEPGDGGSDSDDEPGDDGGSGSGGEPGDDGADSDGESSGGGSSSGGAMGPAFFMMLALVLLRRRGRFVRA